MIEESDLTLDQLLDRWRSAEAALDAMALDAPERAAVAQRAAQTADAYRYRLKVMAQDLRDG